MNHNNDTDDEFELGLLAKTEVCNSNNVEAEAEAVEKEKEQQQHQALYEVNNMVTEKEKGIHKNVDNDMTMDDIDDILDNSMSASAMINEYNYNEAKNPHPRKMDTLPSQAPPNFFPSIVDVDDKQERMKKLDLLKKFHEMTHKGFKLSQNFTIRSSLEDMEIEYENLKSLRTQTHALKLSQGFLINAIQAMEFLNTKYDPMGMDLVGFADVVSLSVDDYSPILEELYEKYKHYSRKVEPEVKLVLMVGAAAASFHSSKQFLNKIPGMGHEQLKKNPSFINKLGKTIINETNRESTDEYTTTDPVSSKPKMKSGAFISRFNSNIQSRNPSERLD